MNGHPRTASGSGSPPPGRSDTYRIRHDFHGPARLSTTLVHAMADAAGVNVTRAEAALHGAVDVDALDRLFSRLPDGRRRGPSQLSFQFQQYRVLVHADGTIAVRAPPAPLAAPASPAAAPGRPGPGSPPPDGGTGY